MPTEQVGNATVTVEYDTDPDDTVECFRDVRERYEPRLKDKAQEHLYALFLDGRNRVLADHLITKGGGDRVKVDISAIVRTASVTNARAVILAHNHPSGTSEVSEEDVDVTEEVADILDKAGISLLDHVIVGDECVSLKQMGRL